MTTEEIKVRLRAIREALTKFPKDPYVAWKSVKELAEILEQLL